MKRVWGTMVAVVLVIALVLSFAACGNANAGKLKELDDLVSQYEGVIADAQAQVDTLTGYMQQYEIESFDENYTQIAATMEELTAQKDEIVGAYNKKRIHTRLRSLMNSSKLWALKFKRQTHSLMS